MGEKSIKYHQCAPWDFFFQFLNISKFEKIELEVGKKFIYKKKSFAVFFCKRTENFMRKKNTLLHPRA